MTKTNKYVFGNKKKVSYVFLGIGLTLFLLNISGMLSSLPFSYNFTAFDISVFSSMLIVLYSTYIIHHEK